MKRLLPLIFLIGIFLCECKKYEDGPWISLRTKTARITGEWDVTSYIVDGIDSTADLKARKHYGPYEFRAKDSDDPASFSTGCSDGIWGLHDNKENILCRTNLNFDSLSTMKPYVQNKDYVWKILRLTKEEMWWEANYNNKDYIVKFKKLTDY